MISPWFIYLLTRLDIVNSIAGLCTFASLAVIFVGGLVAAASYSYTGGDATHKFAKKVTKVAVLPFVLSVIVLAVTPTTKEMAAIYIIPKIANNEKIQECTVNLVELANEWIKELKPNKDKNEKSE